MAAPTPTVRTPPTGYVLYDGYQTLITFATQPAVQLWEKVVKPEGYDGGDPIDVTTMFAVKYRGKAPRSLITVSDATFTAAYDPDVRPTLLSLINAVQVITFRFPDSSTECAWGFLQKIEFADHKEGEQPECTGTIVFTNEDPTARGVTAGPVYTSAAGT